MNSNSSRTHGPQHNVKNDLKTSSLSRWKLDWKNAFEGEFLVVSIFKLNHF